MDDQTPTPINWSAFLEEELDPWQTVWEEEETIAYNFRNLLSRTVVLPNASIQEQIATVYLLQPHLPARILPVLFCWGERGSGKSSLAILATKLRGIHQIFSATDTFASIRNALDFMRWHDPFTKEAEREGVLMAWDNIHAETLQRDQRIYQLLLSGYSRQSDRILIAGADGINREYFVFSAKILSSVDPIHLKRQFEELHRRLIVLVHKPLDRFQEHDLPRGTTVPKLQNHFIEKRIDIDSIRWKGIEKKFFDFWNQENLKRYLRIRKFAHALLSRRKIQLPENISHTTYTVLVDLLTTGIITQMWNDFEAGLEVFSEHFSWLNKNGSTELGANTRLLIQQELLPELFPPVWEKANQVLLESGNNPHSKKIPAKILKAFLEKKRLEGALDLQSINPETVSEVMWHLGFRLKGNYWIER